MSLAIQVDSNCDYITVPHKPSLTGMFRPVSDSDEDRIMDDSKLILTDNAFSFDTLKHAAKLCARGVRWKYSTVNYLNSLNRRSVVLSEKLKDGDYRIHPYHHFSVTEPKPRKISSSALEDRVVQRAMCVDSVYDELVNGLEYNNCACQRDKGTHFALARFAVILRDYFLLHGSTGYVLSIDINKFFDNISHGEVKWIIRDKVSNSHYRSMLYDLIDSFKVDKILEPTRLEDAGIPLGSQLSQIFALNALHQIDKFILRKLHIPFCIHYMDDFRIVCNDINALKLITRLIVGRLECLGYAANKKTRITRLADGIQFLHIRFHLLKSGKIIRTLDRDKFAKERRKLNRLFRKLNDLNDTSVTLGILLRHYQGWRANVVKKVGNRAVSDMDCIFINHLQTRNPKAKLTLSDLDGLCREFKRKFCLSAIRTSSEYELIQNSSSESFLSLKRKVENEYNSKNQNPAESCS